MKLNIAGLHMETGDSLKQHCEDRMLTLKKYFDQVLEVDVSCHEERGKHLAEVTVHASGIYLRALGEGDDFYQAISDAETKLERQLQRYKGRLQKHRKRRQHDNSKLKDMQALAAVHHTVEEDSLEEAPADEAWFAEFAPTIRHKEVKKIDPMSVDEAVMQMDLLHKPAYLFQNAQTGTLNVVYRDTDGSVRWVSPQN
ncbi:MAG: ribosome-associated translation inhibitor RaiA [Alphaproteobacteria bacterium]|nr:ribosome-associated translation inhibitor RaiA [Alphaproteobacteria bacterium]MDD9920306.1 ribosome-associated translation inhibitor RaiA [Alphaproteobacteria bacterium]